ncbi:hypothetical protein S245_001439, partial [Arachis hypogaea]
KLWWFNNSGGGSPSSLPFTSPLSQIRSVTDLQQRRWSTRQRWQGSSTMAATMRLGVGDALVALASLGGDGTHSSNDTSPSSSLHLSLSDLSPLAWVAGATASWAAVRRC